MSNDETSPGAASKIAERVSVSIVPRPSRLARVRQRVVREAEVDKLLRALLTESPAMAVASNVTAESANEIESQNSDPESTDDFASGEQSRPRRFTRRAPLNVQERIRSLTNPQRQKLARTGEQRERVALERQYGKDIWESLLRNPKLTPPEVARIARKGSLPLPQIEAIVNNRRWLRAPAVRRALLSNPRLRGEVLMTVLRQVPKNELKLVPKQTAYPMATRQAAERLLK